MKCSLLIILLFLIAPHAKAQESPRHRWLLGLSPERVRSIMLEKPGRLVLKEIEGDGYFILAIGTLDKDRTYRLTFFSDKLAINTMYWIGVHDSDIDSEYEDLKKIGLNDWFEEKNGIKTYVHREYNNEWTEITISSHTPQ